MAYLQPPNRSAFLGRGLISNAGSVYAIRSEQRQRRRAQLLAEAVRQGKMDVTALSPQDTKLAAGSMDKVGGGGISGIGDFFGDVGGFFGNLGSDVWNVSKSVPSGLYAIGEGIIGKQDPFAQRIVRNKPAPSFQKDVIDPVVDTYRYQYSGSPGEIFKKFYQHPLGPILDAATVASLAAGGSTAALSAGARRGLISPTSAAGRLQKSLTTTERGGIPFDPKLTGRTDLAVPELPRLYSTRPLRRGMQWATDRAASKIPLVARAQRAGTANEMLRMGFSKKKSLEMSEIRHAVVKSGLIDSLSKLNQAELSAFNLINRGVNTPALMETYRRSINAGLEGRHPELKANIGEHEATIDPRLPESRADMSSELQNLVLKPQQSPALMEALQTSRNVVEERILPDIIASKGDEAVRDKRFELVDALKEFADTEGISLPPVATKPSKGYPFPEPTVMPAQVAEGFELKTPGPIAGKLTNYEPQFVRGRSKMDPQNVLYQNLFNKPPQSFKPNAAPMLGGVERPDARAFVDMVAKHERDVVDDIYSTQLLNRVAMKDANGDPMLFSPNEVKGRLGEDWVFVNPNQVHQWYEEETTVAKMMESLENQGFDINSSEFMAAMGAEAMDTTIAFNRMASQKGWAIPRQVADYQRKLVEASNPYKSRPMRLHARALDFWRTWTLSMMIRWALNTFVGSSVLTTLKGVHPGHYTAAWKLAKEEIDGVPIFERSETAGVNLTNVVPMEMLESGAQGQLDQAFGIKVGAGSRKMFEVVQRMEDIFRRGSFMQSLNRQAKQMMRENGAIITNLEKGKGPRTTAEYVDFIINNPEAVNRAVDDVNRFAYNFAALGPTERRVVRQLVPFWGWYKFISGLAYRLPIDYPGRTNLMANVGRIGQAYNEQYGDMPGWLSGVIPLTKPGEKDFSYLSTMGLNPFSTILNPLGPEGPIAGTMQLGQASPVIQSLLTAYGTDTLRGGEVPISPESGVAADFWGNLFKKGDEGWTETDIQKEKAGSRLFASLLRSFPQVRIGERIQSGGRSIYPESIPILAPRYMPTKPESRFGSGLSEAMQQIVGFAPRPYDLRGYQSRIPEQAKYARTNYQRQLKKIRKNQAK